MLAQQSTKNGIRVHPALACSEDALAALDIADGDTDAALEFAVKHVASGGAKAAASAAALVKLCAKGYSQVFIGVHEQLGCKQIACEKAD